MTKAELGARRRCLSCDTPFFDLNRMPIICPKCAVAFQVVEIAHSPPRARAVPPGRYREMPAPIEPVAADAVLLVDDEEDAESSTAPTEDNDEIQEIEAIT